MDLLYLKKACLRMHWYPVSVEIPSPSSCRGTTDSPSHNRGYGFLTFASQAEVDAVLAQVADADLLMPDSSRQFTLKQHYFCVHVSNLSVDSSEDEILGMFKNPPLDGEGTRGYKRNPFTSVRDVNFVAGPTSGLSHRHALVKYVTCIIF